MYIVPLSQPSRRDLVYPFWDVKKYKEEEIWCVIVVYSVKYIEFIERYSRVFLKQITYLNQQNIFERLTINMIIITIGKIWFVKYFVFNGNIIQIGSCLSLGVIGWLFTNLY